MKITRILLALVILLAVCEVALRLIWGFGTPVLYSESKQFEYIYAPYQDVHRYGNHITTNSLGMRSPEPADNDSIRILYLGDSVINGGMHVTQDNLSSTLLAESLSRLLHKKVNVLNISAGSWGPDNAAAFLKEHGTFNACAMVLVFSSHDAFDTMDFEPIVNRNVHYPGEKPFCALSEVVVRYVIPAIASYFGNSEYRQDKLMISSQRKQFNPGWKSLLEIAHNNSLPVYVVLHAEQAELQKREYNTYGKRIIDTLTVNNVPYVTDLSLGIQANDYRDFIHLNENGQHFLAEKLTAPLQKIIQAGCK